MNTKKRSSALKKVADDETQPNITDIIQKRRISFSGRKLVREFCGEEETKAWKDSYEESDRSNNSEVPTICNKSASIRVSDSKLFHQKAFDSSESPTDSLTNAFNCKDAQKTFLSKTIDYVNSSCQVGAINFYDTLHVTLTEKEKEDFYAFKNELQTEVSISETNKSSFIDTIFKPNDSQIFTPNEMELTTAKDIQNIGSKIVNNTVNMDIEIDHVPKNPQKNWRQSVRNNQDMDIELREDKENIPIALHNMDIKNTTDRIEDTPMHISLHVKDVPNKELQKTMFYNHNIDGVISDAPMQSTTKLRKTILFNENDAESNIDIEAGKCETSKGLLSINQGKTTTDENNHSAENSNHTDRDNLTKTTIVNDAKRGVVVRKITVKTPQSKSKDICNSNNKRWEKYKGSKVIDSESNENRKSLFKTSVIDNKTDENCKSLAKTSDKTEPLNKSDSISNLTYDPFSSIFPDSDDGINALLQSDEAKKPSDHLSTKDNSQMYPNSMKNLMNVELEKLRESTHETLAEKPISKLSSYKNKLPRYSQADELLLDNTSYLTKAKLGDETSSRNSSKYTPASINKENEIIFQTNSNNTCMANTEECENTRPYVCKSLNFSKMSDSASVAKEIIKANKLDLTEDFAQPLSQTILFNSSDDIDISTIQSNPPTSELQSNFNQQNRRHTMMFSDDIELESNDLNHQQINVLRSVNKSSSKTLAMRQTLLLCKNIELVEDDNAKYLKKDTNLNLSPKLNPTGRRNTILMREDIAEDHIEDKREETTEYSNKNELDERQWNAKNLSSISKPTGRRNTILMREDIEEDQIEYESELAEQKTTLQAKEYLDKNESNKRQYHTQILSSILKPTARRNTILLREDIYVEEIDDKLKVIKPQITSQTKEFLDKSKSDKEQCNTNSYSSISKPTTRRNTILMREDIRVDKMDDKLETAEQQITLQTKEFVDQNESTKDVSSKSKPSARRNTMLLLEDMQLEETNEKPDTEQLSTTNTKQYLDKQQHSILPNSFKLQRDESVAIAEQEMASQIQKSILGPFEGHNKIINECLEIESNAPKRHTIYEQKDMQLEIDDEGKRMYDSQPNYSVTKGNTSSANYVYMTTTPRRNYDSAAQRSFIEFVNNERQSEMSVLMEEQDNDMKSMGKRRQTTCRPIDMEGSFDCSELSKKRLAFHLTPNISVAKKRQTYDCELDESQTTQTDNVNDKPNRPQMQTPFNKNRLIEESDVDDMQISPVVKSLNELNISVEMELEPQDYTDNVKHTTKLDSPSPLQIQKIENTEPETNSIALNSGKTQLNPLADNVKQTPVKSNVQNSRIPVPIGSARKSTPKMSHKESDESDVYIIDDDLDELETIPNPRKAMTVPRRSMILPKYPDKLANQTIDDNQGLLQNTMINVSRFRQSLNILDFDDIDKTNMSLVGTLDNADSEVVDVEECSNAKVEEVIDVEQKPPQCDKYNTNASEISTILCRKCKQCQDTILNETTMSSFVLPKNPVIPLASLEALRKIRKRPNLIDVHNYYRRLSLAQDISYHHEDTIVLGTSHHEPEDEVDTLISNYHNKVEQAKKEVQASIANETRPFFVERFQTLLKSHSKNWIFDYQKQNQNIYLFYHRKITTTAIAVLYEDLMPLGKDIRVQSVQLAKSFFAPEKHWNPINYIMDFQLQLELTGVDMTVNKGDHSLLDLLLRVDKTFAVVRRLSMALWKIVILADASLERDGSQTYIRKLVCTITCSNGQYPKVEETEFRIRVLNVNKISYKDIILPPLHMFHENIQLMPTGLEFVREFLKEPKSHLRNL